MYDNSLIFDVKKMSIKIMKILGDMIIVLLLSLLLLLFIIIFIAIIIFISFNVTIYKLKYKFVSKDIFVFV